MKYSEYISNPMGKGAVVMTNRAMYQKLYTEKWEALMVKENGNIPYKQYKKDEDYYIYIKLPSDSLEKLYYDIVIKFYLDKDKKAISMEPSLSNYEVQFYSNDPGFIFGFAFAFHKHKLLIPELEKKIGKLALKEAPVRNPKAEIGYVKSLYISFLTIRHYRLFDKNRWVNAEKYTSSALLKNVMHSDEKLQESRELSAAKAKKAKREKKVEQIKEVKLSKAQKEKIFASPNPKNFGKMKTPNYNKLNFKKIK